AWRQSLIPPSGPTYLEIPVDLLTATAPSSLVAAESSLPLVGRVGEGVVDEAATLLSHAKRPVIWAGGGVLRSHAWAELAALAERIGGPVATTYMGKGAFPDDHPLSAGSACDDRAFQELLEQADVVLAVGTELGAETTAQYQLRFGGRLVQIDADPSRIGATYPALGLVGDARTTLQTLLSSLPLVGRAGEGVTNGAQRARAVRERITRGLDDQRRELERGLLSAIRSVLPRDAVS